MPSVVFYVAIRGEDRVTTQSPDLLLTDKQNRMECFDVHTHRLTSSAGLSFLSCRMDDKKHADISTARFLSVGIHPWFLSEDDCMLQFQWLDEMMLDPRTVALGEAGLDKHSVALSNARRYTAFLFLSTVSSRLTKLLH